MPILTCIFFTFNWLTLTSEMHFVKFHPEVASCLLPRGKRKYAPLGMRPLWKYIRNYFLVYQLISPFLVYLQNYKEFEAEILDLQSEKYGLSFDIKKYTTSGWALGDENVNGIRAFNECSTARLNTGRVLYNNNYIILDGIEGCMRIYCTRHDDIHRAGTARWLSSWHVQYILIQPEIKPSNIIII